MNDPKDTTTETDDTDGNNFKIVKPEGETDDTEGHGAHFIVKPEGDTDDTEGNVRFR